MRIEQRLEALHNTKNQQGCYTRGRAFVFKATGSTKNACAAVCSEYLKLMGHNIGSKYNTGQVHKGLHSIGYEIVGDLDQWKDVQPGDILFAIDKNNNGMPDHVCICYSRPTVDGSCLVLDNYAPRPKMRNLTAGRRLPLLFFMRYTDPVEEQPDGQTFPASDKGIQDSAIPHHNSALDLLLDLDKNLQDTTLLVRKLIGELR